MIISVAPKARIKKICRDVKRVIYIRWRLIGSEVVWFWLARIIKGSSQHVSTRRGVERGSVAMYRLREVQPVSDRLFSQLRLARAISRLCIRVVGQSHLAGVSQVVGMSISVGMRIFSIAVGLGFVGGRFRVFGWWQLVVQDRCLLRMLRMLEEV